MFSQIKTIFYWSVTFSIGHSNYLDMKRTILFSILSLTGALVPLKSPADQTFKTAEAQVNLIELYTSEGCSSCPPADLWLRNLRKKPELWSRFVPLAFHVDYWDHLGWKDKYAKSEFTQRQKTYGYIWGTGTIYTPEMVLNGNEWRAWRSSDLNELRNSKGNPGVLEASLKNGKLLSVKFYPTRIDDRSLKLNVATLRNSASSLVKAGENSGSNLQHGFIVNCLDSKNLVRSGKIYSSEHSLCEVPSGPASFAAWVTNAEGTIIQAIGGDIR